MARISRLTLFMVLFFSVVFHLGCNRKDPNPELIDPLYQELEKQKKSAEAELKAAQDALIEAEANLKKVTPQTGQIKYAQKRFNDAKNKVIKGQQIVTYYAVKIEARKWSARSEYTSAFYDKTPYPSTAPLESFKLNQQLSQNERDWSAKKRREELGFPNKDTQKATQAKEPAGGGSAPPPAH